MGLFEGVILQEILTVLPVFEHAQVDMDLYSNTVDVIPVADLFSHFGYCPSSQLCENCFHRTWYVHCQFIFTTFAMERSNETRALQGGGSGGGLEVPFAILRTEHENRPTIMRRLCAPGSSEGLMGVWNESLMNRCFVLNARAQLNTFGQHRVDRHETDEPFHLKTKQNNPARPFFSNTGTGIANSVFKSQKTQVKLVPGVPKNVEDAIRLWLEGDHFPYTLSTSSASLNSGDLSFRTTKTASGCRPGKRKPCKCLKKSLKYFQVSWRVQTVSNCLR